MNIKEKLGEVYKLYSKGDFLGAKKINDEILASDPNNVYAKKYKELLAKKLNNSKLNKEEKIRVKGKILKCPACLAKIPFSALTSEQREKIKSGNYNNLEIKCPYCHKKFVLQKRKAPSVLGLKIGDFATIEGKKYRITGYVDYLGTWYEGNYSGSLWYLEWILVGDKGNYKYFSEGGFYDDGDRNEEFEISEKIIPKFSLKPDYKNNYILINNKKVYFKEKNIVRVKSIYGENSKVFTVGEKIELYEFSFGGKNYVIEKEGAGTQTEAGIYEKKSISRRKAFDIFGKNYKDSYYSNNSFSKQNGNDFINNILAFGIVGFFIFVGIVDELGLDSSVFLYFLAFLIVIIAFFSISKMKNETSKNIILAFILIPILSIFSYFIFNNILDTKKEISLEKLNFGKKIELNFNNPEISKEKVVGRTRYDYGGIETKYEKKTGLKFSIKSDEDKKVLEKIKEIVGNSSTNSLKYNEKKIKEMFENGKIYLLRE